MIPTPSPALHRPRPRPRRARLAGSLLLAAVLTSGCGMRDAYESAFSIGWLDPVTEEGEQIYELWLGSAAAAAVVGAFVWGLMLWTGFRYRKKSDELPRQVRYNLPIEVLYTVVPFVILAVLFYYTTITQNFVNDLTTEQEGGPDVTIGVVGFQWNWAFNYLDENVGVVGETTRPPVLVLPTNRTIRFIETSPDVIHSFYVPQFLFKRDVIPGRENTFEITIEKEGEYIGRCAEFCGEKHSAMNFVVRVVSPEAYDTYVEELKSDPNNAIVGADDGAVIGATSDAESES